MYNQIARPSAIGADPAAGRGMGTMTASYAYTPAIWPLLLTAGLLAVLAVFAWHRRAVPGARPFAAACLFALIWVAGAAAESLALDPAAKLGWFKFQAVWQLPVITAITCFVLDYANPGRWLTRRTLILLSIAPLLELALLLTNDLHHWHWLGFSVGATVVPQRGPAFWVMFAYSLCLMLVNLLVFVWLFICSPRHRLPVALMLLANLAGRSLNALEVAGRQAILGWDPFVFAILITFGIYAVALFGFRIFDPVAAARRALIAQLREGVLVLDPEGRVAGLNPAAERILCLPERQATGRPVVELLPDCPQGPLAEPAGVEVELTLPAAADRHHRKAFPREGGGPGERETGQEVRQYVLEISPLTDWRGLEVGRLLVLRDVTEERLAQAQLVEQQRALAMLHEREQLARELHDGIGQVLGFASLKTGATRKLIADGRLARADEQLAHLESIMADAHADVREYILNLRTAPAEGRPFFAALEHYVAGFRQNYDIQVELSVGAGVGDNLLGPEAQMQILRIVQEAFSNVRKHAGADHVRLSFETGGGLVRVRIQDNGQGFDPQRAAGDEDSHFGLRFMRERAGQVGGTLRVDSAPGQGTCLTVEVPVG
jgi:signal transduction histidine kinase